jgi:hypothetical protein
MFAPRFTRRSTAPALLAISILVVLAACSPAASSNPSEAASASPPVGATSEQPSASAAPTATPEPTPGVGVRIPVGEQQYVTVTLVEQWAGTDTLKPAAGNVFVTANIRIDAITTTDFTSADFTVKDADGKVYTEILGRSPRLSFQNGLTPNTYYAGFVTFEVPADMDADLTLVYAPNFLTTTYEIPLQ